MAFPFGTTPPPHDRRQRGATLDPKHDAESDGSEKYGARRRHPGEVSPILGPDVVPVHETVPVCHNSSRARCVACRMAIVYAVLRHSQLSEWLEAGLTDA